ncbi:hypothetical protein KR222_005550 [Zaprionus bogoriensis]|nr:hypothetical protein KR222_005550 [Zaprionus bogoriensis]
MDRQTRKANFKKLQQPAASSTKLRSTRSRAAAATMTLSEYFNSQENLASAATQSQLEQEPAEREDLFAEPKTKKTRECQDVEPAPAAVKPKKAPKLKATTSTRRGAAAGKRGRGKKQPSISDFLRNEQLFAEVTAQHCLADNFSPDDVEMALALSKSEAEKYGILRLQDTQGERGEAEEEVVNLLEDQANQSTEIVRRKLQKYGFRTAAKEEYNLASIAAIPGVGGKRGKRCKWANKFTALTLRNPVEQQKKLEAKVAALMAQQVRTRLPSNVEQAHPFQLLSSRLQLLQATARITYEPSAGSITNLNAYYVEELFEVSRTPAHHLLKNWSAIQGRDLSPKRPSAASLRRQQQLEQVYAELEQHFGCRQSEQAELDELEKLVADNMIEEVTPSPASEAESAPLQQVADTPTTLKLVEITSSTATASEHVKNTSSSRDELECTSSLSAQLEDTPSTEESPAPWEQLKAGSPLKEPPDKRARMSSSEKENLQPSSASLLSIPTQSTRCVSPDLFADSDDELEAETATPKALAQLNLSPRIYNETTSSEINCYEIYSSDEVKTVTEEQIVPEAMKECLIDLTQEQDSPELPVDTSNPRASVCAIEFGEEFDVMEEPASQPEDCAISDVLLKKYAFKAVEEAADGNFFNSSMPDSVKSTASSSSHNVTSSASLSFTQSDSVQHAFQRSFSFTSANLEQSFKSPLSRKSNSFTDRPAVVAASPFSHSDASIDLTQDDDGEESDGVLLSDDEINYSIWKADKTFRGMQAAPDSNSSSESDTDCVSPLTKRKTMPYFKTLDDLDAYLDASPAAAAPAEVEASNSRSPNKSLLSRERAEFGILDAALSQPMTLSQLPTEDKDKDKVAIDWAEASFLETPPELPLKRLSSSHNHKFKELLNMPNPAANPSDDDEFDEFDCLVLGKPNKSPVPAANSSGVPSGLDRLLMGEINTDTLSEASVASSSKPAADTPQQLEVNGQVYTVRICNEAKPDFVLMPEAELLQQLYKYGIRPLKRKQAVKLLEFIYNQTHPIMLPLEEPPQPSEPLQHVLARSKSTPVASSSSKSKAARARLQHAASNECLTPTVEQDTTTSYDFRDAPGADLLYFSQAMPPALCDDFECYVLQTNVTKKTPQPLLPLHIAWHNLLCANPSFHESVLMFEPIDLQQIYVYFKQVLGLRYDPKDLKGFFDRRCIIFRYALATPAQQAQRHVRKKPRKKASSKV